MKSPRRAETLAESRPGERTASGGGVGRGLGKSEGVVSPEPESLSTTGLEQAERAANGRSGGSEFSQNSRALVGCRGWGKSYSLFNLWERIYGQM